MRKPTPRLDVVDGGWHNLARKCQQYAMLCHEVLATSQLWQESQLFFKLINQSGRLFLSRKEQMFVVARRMLRRITGPGLRLTSLAKSNLFY